MGEDSTRSFGNVIRIDDERNQAHLQHIVRGSVEETLNALLDAEANRQIRLPRSGPSGQPIERSQLERGGYDRYGRRHHRSKQSEQSRRAWRIGQEECENQAGRREHAEPGHDTCPRAPCEDAGRNGRNQA